MRNLGPSPLQTKEALIAELRKNPLRHLAPSELPLLDSTRAYGRAKEIRISDDSFRTIYGNAFVFFSCGRKTGISLFETSFDLSEDGSVSMACDFLNARRVFLRALDLGMGQRLMDYCYRWRGYAESRGLDPNDTSTPLRNGVNWRNPHNSFDPEEDEKMMEIEKSMGKKDFRIYERDNGIDSFDYLDCIPERTTVFSRKMSRPHSHIVSHLHMDSFFPSQMDFESPVIWTTVDLDFIKSVMKDPAIPDERKGEFILDRHLEGIKGAICIGTRLIGKNFDCIEPLVRAGS